MIETVADELVQPRVDELPGLMRILESNWAELAGGEASRVVAGCMYCPRCDGDRAMRIAVRYASGLMEGRSVVLPGAPPEFVPALIALTCVQCNAAFTAVIYGQEDGPTLAVLPARHATLSTRHTSPPVAFYLDQAKRAESAGAASASLAMYRVALEGLLAEQGYMTGSLGLRLHQLAKGVETGAAPKWALELEPEFHAVLQRIGESPTSLLVGDANGQLRRDSEILALLDDTFRMLLFLVYEVPHEKSERLKALRNKTEALFR
ncbi:MAG: hypothetical protein M1401_01010 [Chloroflexi bacterium]|nr:hypothetical protein [Chloroflexota bacterium]MCL5107456.1 hypothetical protein [Chloroflexota bacterium]